jgi:hypothetical protein
MLDKELTIFIKGNIPSLKNSKIKGKFPSKTVMKWLRLYGIQSYSASRKEVKFFKTIPKKYNFEDIASPLKKCTDYPLKLGFHFIRDSKRNWDFGNACQIVQDLLVAFDYIPDDNVNYVLPFPLEIDGKYWSYDKDNSGVIIKIL